MKHQRKQGQSRNKDDHLCLACCTCSRRWRSLLLSQCSSSSSGSWSSCRRKRTGSQPVTISYAITQPREWETMDTLPPFCSNSGFREQKSKYKRLSSWVRPLVIYRKMQHGQERKSGSPNLARKPVPKKKNRSIFRENNLPHLYKEGWCNTWCPWHCCSVSPSAPGPYLAWLSRLCLQEQ